MTFLPAVVQAQYRSGHRIRVVFNDGVEATLSFRRWLKGPIFGPLRDLDYFRRFYLDGGTVAWPNGADIAPETLYTAMAGKARRNRHSGGTKARRLPSRRTSKRQRRTHHSHRSASKSITCGSLRLPGPSVADNLPRTGQTSL